MDRQGSGLRIRGLAVAGAGLFALALIAIAAPQAGAAVVSCPATIMSCGCTITDSALHLVGANLDPSSGLNKDGSCINIKKSFATLDVDFFDIDGAGSGIGIRILKGAKRVSVQNWDEIADWDVGIEDDGNGALISSCGDCDVDDNTTAGVLLNRVKRTTVTGFDANGNGTGFVIKGGSRNQLDALDAPNSCGGAANGTGILLTGTNNNTVQSFCANCSCGFGEGNTGDGVDLVRSNNNAITDFSTEGNGGNGVLLDHSSQNIVGDYDASDNGGAGVLLDPGSNHNTLSDSSVFDNVGNGIEVDSGDKVNSIFFDDSSGNATDLVDGNTNCDKDVWSNNCFLTSSQACIGVPATRC